MYDILNEITETRIYCGFRENMNQESTKPYRRSRFKMAWLIDSWMFYPRIYDFLNEISRIYIFKQICIQAKGDISFNICVSHSHELMIIKTKKQENVDFYE